MTCSYVDEKAKLHTVYYPTLKFLAERIALAKKVKCGIAIWELGQGLDYFFDLLWRTNTQRITLWHSSDTRSARSSKAHR